MALSQSAVLLLIVAGAGVAEGGLSVAAHGSLSAGQRPNMSAWEASQAALAANQSAADAKDAKMAAVGKVISMLENLQSKVMSEGEEEAKTYNKFACFCKDTTSEKSGAIQSGEDKKLELSTAIGALQTRRGELDTDIGNLQQAITTAEGEVKTAESARSQEKKVYTTNEADLSGAIYALENAISSLKASKNPTLAQLKAVAKTVSTAAVMAEALGLGGDNARKVAAFFLQSAPTVPTEDYSFHSDSIVTTLEGLLTDFRSQKTTLDSDEVSAISAHDSFLQAKANFTSQKERELDTARQEKAQKQEEIATSSQDLSTVAAELLNDQEYLTELSQMCSDKASTWDQRSQLRSDELSALSSALAILKGSVSEHVSGATIRFAQKAVRMHVVEALARNEGAMEAMEAAAEAAEAGAPSSPPFAFLQRNGRSLRSTGQGPTAADGRQAVITLLRNKGAELRSTALAALAGELSADPFAKVKQLIQELIERLQKQSSNEATQKGWCDKSISEAKQKRTYASEKVEELNGNLARLEAMNDSLTEELSLLQSEMTDLTNTQSEAVQMRTQEQGEHNSTVAEATAGMDAVDSAITILDRFYKTAAKAAIALAQKGPADDAPDAGFGLNETYTGSQSEAGGVIGMLEVIKSDFRRTISETQQAEVQAQQDHLVFMTETGKSLAEKETAQTEKTRQKGTAEDQLIADGESLRSEVSIMESAITELLQLKEACQTGMTYEERTARRDEEIAALKQAVCILEGYAEYGPSGAGSDC